WHGSVRVGPDARDPVRHPVRWAQRPAAPPVRPRPEADALAARPQNRNNARATQRVAFFVARTTTARPHRPPQGDAQLEPAIPIDPRPRLREKGLFVAPSDFSAVQLLPRCSLPCFSDSHTES